VTVSALGVRIRRVAETVPVESVGKFSLLEYRAVCSSCGAKVSRRGFYQALMKCNGCGALLQQNGKWKWLGSIPLGLLIGGLLSLGIIGLLNWGYAILGVLVVVLIGHVTFPYCSKYEPANPQPDPSGK